MMNLVNSNNVVGIGVENSAGEDLGQIEALMIDKISGQVAYVVLSFGGFLGLGDKLFALPWKVFSYDPVLEKFILNVDKEKLKNSPGFDKENWPDMNADSFTQAIRSYYFEPL
ncbi:PRC-barrel domain-containing protein [Legionella sainthelensi]|uniref:Photosystem reaction center subunit H n=2 Tax=Legionella sainthelensi TaxID=28087 RepID=A0A2H5FME7_9GAMM|nr:PRC-barrel domain-containing protein [Legionella sainthelensi]AUH72726.1 PRC-barrel domain containing protein [Legionella sainthelensi]